MEELTVLFHKDGETITEDKFGKTYIINENNQAVVMLARHLDSFILVKQFRRAINDYAIQLPGGKVENEEELEEAVRREFLEEVGGLCGKVQYLGSLIPASWLSNVVTHVFYTDDIVNIADQKLEDYENIEVLKVGVQEAIKMIKDGKINDSEATYAILQGVLKGFIKL